MNAHTLLDTISILEPTTTTLETSKQVLNELHRLKRSKSVHFITIRRAINLQTKRIKKQSNDSN